MPWWNDEDWIDPSQWMVSCIEVMGTTHDMCWVMNTVTGESGLFKPESHWRKSAYCEYAASKIAQSLNIPSAKVIVGDFRGKPGCISFDVRKGCADRVVTGDALYNCGNLVNFEESKGSAVAYGRPDELSFLGLLPFLQRGAEISLVQMMFFDCITRNSGRHPSNFSFAIDSRPAISGLLPLYDHGWCIQENRFMRGGSAFGYYGPSSFHRSFPFDSLYECMLRDYPELIETMVEKAYSSEFKETTEKLECYGFIMRRIESFQKLK